MTKALTQVQTALQPTGATGELLRLQREYGNRFVRRAVVLSRKGQGEGDVTPEVEAAIQRERGGGQALDSAARAQIEPAMGADFSGVRVHTGGQADTLNRTLSARAFTTGQDIFFKQGEYSPGSSSGRELLAHELTHVVQQDGDRVRRKLTVGAAGDPYEREADQVASSVMRQEQQPVKQPIENRHARGGGQALDNGERVELQWIHSNTFTQRPIQSKPTKRQPEVEGEREANKVAGAITHTLEPYVSERVSLLKQTRVQLSPSPGTSVWGGFRIHGDSAYIARVRTDLNALNTTRTGRTLLADIAADRSSLFSPLIRIESGACGYLPGRIYYNASGCPVSGCPGPWSAVPNYVYLFHEVVHAYLDYIAGKGTHPERECMTTGLGIYFTSIPYNENRLRCELGLPVRPCYDGQCIKFAPPTCASSTPSASSRLHRWFGNRFERQVLAFPKPADETEATGDREAIHQIQNKNQLPDKSVGDVAPLQRQLRPERPTPTSSQRRGRLQRHSAVVIHNDTQRARIDNSKGIDEITRDFYHIPVDLLPPNTPVPSGPILTLGRYGCDIRRYGLTVDTFSLTHTLNDSDIQHFARPWSFGGLHTVECWASRVRFRVRLRQTIYLPNDLGTHPCTRGTNPGQQRREILEHERGHELDNNIAAESVRNRLRESLAFTFGIGYLMPMVRITDDPEAFAQECARRIRQRLDELQQEHEIMYARLSAEFASSRDPHDRELHMLKLRLLEAAGASSSSQQ